VARTVSQALVASSRQLHAAGSCLELRGQAAMVDGQWCDFAPAQMALLRVLAAEPGRVVAA
jgi:uroporphyrinogen-III synthase